eukprot:536893_1
MKRRSRATTLREEDVDSKDLKTSQRSSFGNWKAIVCPSFLVFVLALVYLYGESFQTKIVTMIPESYDNAQSNLIPAEKSPKVEATHQSIVNPPIPSVTLKNTKQITHQSVIASTNMKHNDGDMYPRASVEVNITDFPPTLQDTTYYGIGGLRHSPPHKCNCPVPNEVPQYSAVQYDEHHLLNTIQPPKNNMSYFETFANYDEYLMRSSLNKSCRSGFGMWAPWTKPGYHKCMAQNVGYAWRLKPGDIVLDMGSGCGHTLLQWVHWYGVFGVGFDWQNENVLYSNYVAGKNNLTAHFYQASIQSIYLEEWIPNQSFDYIHTNAVLMYLDPPTACLVIQKTIQILKVNGSAWFGWNKGGMMTRGKLDMCMESFANVNQKNINVTWFDRSQMKELMDTCQKSKEYPSFMIQRTA